MDMLAENYDIEAKKDDGNCTYARDQFIGTYQVSEECVYEGKSNYAITITDGPTVVDIIIQNFANQGVNLKATIIDNEIVFTEVEVLGIVYSGTGYLSNNILTINYTACEAFYFPCSDEESCVMTGTK